MNLLVVELEVIMCYLFQQRVERVRHSGKLVDEPPVDISQDKKLSHVCVFRWRLILAKRFDIGFLVFKLARIGPLSKIFHLELENETFCNLHRDNGFL